MALKSKVILVLVAIILVILLDEGCGSAKSFDSRLRSITSAYSFSIARWEFNSILNELRLSSGHDRAEDEAREVWDFFALVGKREAPKSLGEPAGSNGKGSNSTPFQAELDKLQQQNLISVRRVEKVLQKQLRDTLSEQSIFSTIGRLKIYFPPLNFKLEEPLNLLVISPRDKIESIREVLLTPNLSVETMERIEDKADKLGVSSLVVELGGFAGTYPTLVTNQAGLRFTIDAAAEEWIHQYLAFKPLGFRYILDLTGIARDYEIATMNETVASMVGKEIGAILYKKYYAKFDTQKPLSPTFNFNQSMREIRRKVDEYLARGDFKPAEEFMKERQKYLASNGYYIRKLNQAYFAFYGAYADSEAAISLIGAELKKLRSQSASLKEFLETTAAMTSRQDLINKTR